MINYEFTLDYILQPGWMAPFIEGLREGRAVAIQCSNCDRVTFPPVRTCSCGEAVRNWIELANCVDIVYHCDGLDGQFALVRFTGADTMSVVKLEGFESPTVNDSRIFGVLKAASGELPALIVGPAT